MIPVHLQHLKPGSKVFVEFAAPGSITKQHVAESVWREGTFEAFVSGDAHEEFERVHVTVDGAGIHAHPLCVSPTDVNTLQFAQLRVAKNHVRSIENFIELGWAKVDAIELQQRSSAHTEKFWEENIIPYIN